MSQLVFLRHAARSLPRVILSRTRRGPARPSWSFGFELFATALRGAAFDFAARSWGAQRVAWDGLASVPDPVTRRVTRTDTSIGGVPCEWFVPRYPEADPSGRTFLYFHGGAYIFGSTRSHAGIITRIALASPARVLAPNYRLAPEHRFPAAIDDALAVYRALLASGVDPKRIVVGGDSAGGGLTCSLLMRLRDAGEPLPAGAVLICPWVDLTAEGGSHETNEPYDWGSRAIADAWKDAYLGDHPRSDPFASPALGDLRGLPRMLVQAGEAELIVDQVSALERRAREHGVDVRLSIEKDMVHDWHTFATVFPRCRAAIDEIGAFVREVTPAK